MIDITGSLKFGLIVLLIAVLVSHVTTFFHAVGSWITWYKDIRHIYSLPSPPRRWLSGNALEVSNWLTKELTHELCCKTLRAHNFYPRCFMAVMCIMKQHHGGVVEYLVCAGKFQGYMYVSHILQSCETTKAL